MQTWFLLLALAVSAAPSVKAPTAKSVQKKTVVKATKRLVPKAKPVAHAQPNPAAQAYATARAQYDLLDGNAKQQRFRHNFMGVIAAFTAIASQYPQSPEAPRALYMAGQLWARLQRVSHRVSDLNQALAAYERLEKSYGKSPLADDALLQRAQLFLERRSDAAAGAREVRELLRRYPKSDSAVAARILDHELKHVVAAPGPSPSDAGDAAPKLFGHREERGPTPQVQDIKSWSNPVYTRVAVYLSAPAETRLGELPEDKIAGSPPRIFVDIVGATLAPTVKAETAVDDELLQRIRIAQRTDTKVRLVLDLKKAARPRVVVMENPYRVVVDAMVGEEETEEEAHGELPPIAGLVKRRRVVIDAGHGGHDSGAVGPGGCREKDVVLAIAKNVQQMLDAAGVEAILTRDDDTFISLEERTAIANRLRADAFVSIHANSAPHGRARGIETYYLNVTDDRYSIRLAAVENKTSEEQVSDLQLILADLSTKANTQESVNMARRVQKRLVQYARPLNGKTRDLGVKASLFYVLLGARMPAILVETSFISNSDEARLLANATYQQRLAKAVADSVVEHLNTPLKLVGP